MLERWCTDYHINCYVFLALERQPKIIGSEERLSRCLWRLSADARARAPTSDSKFLKIAPIK
jgi:hypothetical protein